MREHLYKGFYPDKNGKTEITLNGEKIKGEWIEGDLIHSTNGNDYIIQNFDAGGFTSFLIIPETVCEFSGLPDKNGNKIFDGHIVKLTPPKEDFSIRNPSEERILEVVFFEGMFAVNMSKWWKYGTGKLPLRDYETDRLEIVGNIFENRSLLNRKMEKKK